MQRYGRRASGARCEWHALNPVGVAHVLHLFDASEPLSDLLASPFARLESNTGQRARRGCMTRSKVIGRAVTRNIPQGTILIHRVLCGGLEKRGKRGQAVPDPQQEHIARRVQGVWKRGAQRDKSMPLPSPASSPSTVPPLLPTAPPPPLRAYLCQRNLLQPPCPCPSPRHGCASRAEQGECRGWQ